jgi:hypothetical protein
MKIEEVKDIQSISKRIHFLVAVSLKLNYYIESVQKIGTNEEKKPEGIDYNRAVPKPATSVPGKSCVNPDFFFFLNIFCGCECCLFV